VIESRSLETLNSSPRYSKSPVDGMESNVSIIIVNFRIGAKRGFRKRPKPLRWVHVQTRVSRVENFMGGGCLSKSIRSHRGCNRKCNRYTATTSHSAHLDANSPKGYSALPSRLSWAVCGDWSTSKPDSDWSRKLLSWQRDRGFDPHPLRQIKLVVPPALESRLVDKTPRVRPTNQDLIRLSFAPFLSTLA
jgi:hypothetical protein